MGGHSAELEVWCGVLCCAGATDHAVPCCSVVFRAVQPGGIRRIIVPVELGYPDNDYNKAGPKPTTFSGE